jgi:hypothetical protein
VSGSESFQDLRQISDNSLPEKILEFAEISECSLFAFQDSPNHTISDELNREKHDKAARRVSGSESFQENKL